MKKFIIFMLLLCGIMTVQAQENRQSNNNWHLQASLGMATSLNYSGLSLLDFEENKFLGNYANVKIGFSGVLLDISSMSFNMRYNSELKEVNNTESIGLLLEIPSVSPKEKFSFGFNVGFGLLVNNSKYYNLYKHYDSKTRLGGYGKIGLDFFYNFLPKCSIGLSQEFLCGSLKTTTLPSDIRNYRSNHINNVTMATTSILLRCRL